MWIRRRFFSLQSPFGLTATIWLFGYLLVDILSVFLGRATPGIAFLFSIPMLILGVGQTLAVDRLREYWAGRPVELRWGITLAGLVGATAIQSLFDLYWKRWVAMLFLPGWQEWALEIDRDRILTVGTVYLWTFCLTLTMLRASRINGAAESAARRAAIAEAEAARIEASLHRAEAAALRLQLNPHFLFNTLNSISSLVMSDRKEAAEEMIERLCEFLRTALGSDPTADVRLAQEIDMIDAYLAVEGARFGDTLAVEIEVCTGASDALVPNFLLQPLVENAIKHGIASARGPSSLSVVAMREEERLVLRVENSTGGRVRPCDLARSNGIGLANIRQRLANQFGEAASLVTGATERGFRAEIRLPFVRARLAPG